jgi:hypothetical protein
VVFVVCGPRSSLVTLVAVADQVSQSVQRMSGVDLDEFSERYGIDAERARGLADMAGQCLSYGMSSGEPLFVRDRHDHRYSGASARLDAWRRAPGSGSLRCEAGEGTEEPVDRVLCCVACGE